MAEKDIRRILVDVTNETNRLCPVKVHRRKLGTFNKPYHNESFPISHISKIIPSQNKEQKKSKAISPATAETLVSLLNSTPTASNEKSVIQNQDENEQDVIIPSTKMSITDIGALLGIAVNPVEGSINVSDFSKASSSTIKGTPFKAPVPTALPMPPKGELTSLSSHTVESIRNEDLLLSYKHTVSRNLVLLDQIWAVNNVLSNVGALVIVEICNLKSKKVISVGLGRFDWGSALPLSCGDEVVLGNYKTGSIDSQDTNEILGLNIYYRWKKVI